MTKNKSTIKPEKKDEPVSIVAIGASAGGLNALKTFFKHIPEDTRHAYVVVVHLSPEHKSMLADLLQPSLKIPVQQVTKTTALKPGNVYVIPPNANLNTIDTHLRLSKLEDKPGSRAPIDHFFRTLAKTHDGNAAGIILTGTGADGTLGMKEIKEKGGLTIAQDPEEAEYDGMPQSAISTGIIDLVLPIAEMPDYLIRYFSTKPRLSLIDEKEEAGHKEEHLIRNIFSLLKVRTGRDFGNYKTSTLLRRIQRRMQLFQMEEPGNYLEHLRRSPDEIRALSDDFLINVTNFFRDSEVFEYIENEIIPEIVTKKDTDGQIRIWSVGCATGEEAYSMAILLSEAIEKYNISASIQIFASDLHKDSLKKAREGFYPGDIKADVSDERLSKFFINEDGGYHIRKKIREMVVFTPHDLLNDPPFSRLDMIICRNLLIYLSRKIHNDVYDLFHYALLPGGHLILGASEHLENNELFTVKHKDFSVYNKVDIETPEPRLPVFPRFSQGFEEDYSPRRKEKDMPYGLIHYRLIVQYGPPSLIIRGDHQVLHVSESAGRYLAIKGGELSKDVFKLIRSELQVELRSTLNISKEEKRIVRSKPVNISLEGKDKQVIISTRYIDDADHDNLILILFDEYDSFGKQERTKTTDEFQTEHINNLEQELQDTREQLQSMIEEYETSREEMKASNEELQSANEELRSTVEELETSKEELQSMNEELSTLNQENRHKVEELDQLSNDLKYYLASTDIATLFLDKEKRILRYTPKINELFNIRPADQGRPITDQTNKLGYKNLNSDIKKVLKDLQTIEREVKHENGRTYLTRVLPYRTSSDKIEGVVMTFVDISSQKEMEENLRKSKERFQALINASSYSVYRIKPDWTELHELDGQGFFNESKIPFRTWLKKYIHPDDHKIINKAVQKSLENKSLLSLEHRFFRTDNTTGWASTQAVPMLNKNEEIIEWIGAISDITARKNAEKELKESKEYAERIIETLHEPLIILDSNLKVKSANDAFYKNFKVSPENTENKLIYELGNGQWDIPALRELLEDVLPKNNEFNDFVVEHEFKRIGYKIMLLNARRLDKVQLIFLGIRDITKEKEHEQALRKSEERIRLTLDTLDMGTWEMEKGENMISIDQGASRLLGLKNTEQKLTLPELFNIIHPDDRNELEKKIKQAWGKKKDFDIEYRIELNGNIRWLASRGHVVARDGETLMIGVNYDVTERVKAERSLHESETRRLIAIEAADIGDWWLNPETNDFFWSDKVRDMLGVKSDEPESFDLALERTHPDDRDRLLQEIKKAIRPGGPTEYKIEYRIVRPDGKEIWVNSRARTLVFGNETENSTHYLYGAMIDITDRKRSEDALKEAREDAETAARVKEEFLAHMSHEIRTPLNAILGLSHLLLKKDPKKDQIENLNTLNISAENLGRLINNILDFSKIQAGKVSVSTEKIRLPAMIENIYRMHKPGADEKNIIFRKKIGKNIPEYIISDEMKLSQVLNNLISNAIKFTSEGEVELKIEQEKRKKDTIWLKFTIRDTGIGIPEEKQIEIFDIFTQADNSTNRKYTGTGLGLTISKLYLRMLGSDIHLKSEAGKGSEFSFVLPAGVDGQSGDYHNMAYMEIPFEEELGEFSVLIVEDDEFNRMILYQLFNIWNIPYDEASNGEIALKMTKKKKYDLILMDVRMPVMDGFEATKKIRKIKGYKEKTIIALTADISTKVREEVESGLFDDMYIKPIEPDKLKKKILEIGRGER